MKKKVLSALLVTSIVLTGCAADKKSQESSEKPNEVESTVNETTEDVEEDAPTEETSEETTVFVDSRTRIDVEDGSVPIVLDGMSADEIVASLETYTYIYDGDTMEDYGKRFALAPTGIDYRTLDFFYDDYENRVTVISFGSATLDDTTGEITISDRSTVSVDIYIQDPELAKEVYDKMIEAYSEYDIFQDVRPEDNEWYSTSRRFNIQMNFYSDNSAWIRVTRFIVD